ncbi:MAG TPA: hypothetical protein VMV50_03370 [Candidatus Paceibacterota bacterium]|nr:hypothetical protein [Candidatus Paceibacterota bacterium]
MRKLFPLFGIAVALAAVLAYAATQDLSVARAATTATSSLQAQINAHDAQIAALNQQIATYEAELKQVGADKATLQAAINSLNLERQKVEAQIAVTQHQINITQLQIQQIGSNISDIEQQVQANQVALAENIRSLQEADAQPLVFQIFSSDDLASAWTDADAVLQVQSAIQDKVSALQEQERALADQQTASQQKKSTLLSQRASLSSQQTTLTQTKQTKAQLLAQTNAKESTYQQLLARAKAELASFSAFTTNAGGSGLLANQTSCDSWGCYYNQRDTAWGNDPLDGTQYLLKSDGCLVTAMAMVMTHYGYRDVTPVSINANPANFAAYYPAYLLYTINVDGVSATRKSAYIDATLATGNPVIIGLHAYGGTHYVVLVSGSRGRYVMRDPYIPNGKDVSFSAHYTMGEIFGVNKVIVG